LHLFQERTLTFRRVFILFVLLSLTAFSFASKKEKKKEAPILQHLGFSYRQFTAPEDYNWRGSEDRTLSGIVWYPAEAGLEEKDQYIGDPPLFYAGRAAKDAPLAPSWGTYPLVALSHGTGGSALQTAWLGTYLAARGYIVVAVNHPGNNVVTGYTPQGFVEWWERARDISLVISEMLADRRFGTKIDHERIGAAGFSLGGYTMMELAGATTDFNGALHWCEQREHVSACNPPEMPDLVAKFEAMKNDAQVQQAVQHSADSYRDSRIKAVFTIAPAVAQAFPPASLQQITIPVSIVAGGADPNAPVADNAQVFAANIKGAQLTILPGGVGHYTFLDVGTDEGKKKMPQFFVDNPGVDREAVHQQVAEMAADFFDKELAPPKKKR
jgi:predicted dienelactone hydrolase